MSKVKLDERLIAVTHPEALKSSVVSGKNFRITVLTDRLSAWKRPSRGNSSTTQRNRYGFATSKRRNIRRKTPKTR